MKILVRATKKQKKDLLTGLSKAENISFIENFAESPLTKSADAFIDLMFEDDPSTLTDLQHLLSKTVIINSVISTLQETDQNFIRINGWEGFLMKPVWEGSFVNVESKEKAEIILDFLGKKIQWVPDEPGLISPRIISKIINEANLALQEGVSSKEEIDAAMKLGTSYPLGPFEWVENIGVDKIQKLLIALDK